MTDYDGLISNIFGTVYGDCPCISDTDFECLGSEIPVTQQNVGDTSGQTSHDVVMGESTK